MKSKNGKILHVKCNNTLTIQHITAKNSVIYRGLEGLNAVLAKTHSVFQTHSCILSSLSSEKIVAAKSAFNPLPILRNVDTPPFWCILCDLYPLSPSSTIGHKRLAHLNCFDETKINH